MVELVVALGVLMILAAMVVPTIEPMRRQGRLRVGAATVAESLRLARSLAIAQSAAYGVDSPDAGRIRIYSGGGACASPDMVYETRQLPERVLRESLSAPYVSFQPDGSCSGLVVVIRDRDQASDKRTIEAKVASGRVSVSGGSR